MNFVLGDDSADSGDDGTDIPVDVISHILTGGLHVVEGFAMDGDGVIVRTGAAQ